MLKSPGQWKLSLTSSTWHILCRVILSGFLVQNPHPGTEQNIHCGSSKTLIFVVKTSLFSHSNSLETFAIVWKFSSSRSPSKLLSFSLSEQLLEWTGTSFVVECWESSFRKLLLEVLLLILAACNDSKVSLEVSLLIFASVIDLKSSLFRLASCMDSKLLST